MRKLLEFVIRFHFTIMFLLLQTVALVVMLRDDEAKRETVLSSANAVSGYFYENFNFITEYFSLRAKNDALAEENTRYRNTYLRSYREKVPSVESVRDSLLTQKYYYLSARVINNSVNSPHNYLTLDKGRLDGIQPDMGVVSATGIVGVVRAVSDHYASVISVLNQKLRVSAKIKKNGYYGSLYWQGQSHTLATLMEIPNHVEIAVGDTIVTSGYSVIFPEGETIGVISDFRQDAGDSFFEIDVELSTNFKNLSYVYVVGNLHREEQIELEEGTENGQ